MLGSVKATTWPRFSSCFLCQWLPKRWKQNGAKLALPSSKLHTCAAMIWSQDAYTDTLLACITPPDSPHLRYSNYYTSTAVPFPSQIATHSLQESISSHTPTLLDSDSKSTLDGKERVPRPSVYSFLLPSSSMTRTHVVLPHKLPKDVLTGTRGCHTLSPIWPMRPCARVRKCLHRPRRSQV